MAQAVATETKKTSRTPRSSEGRTTTSKPAAAPRKTRSTRATKAVEKVEAVPETGLKNEVVGIGILAASLCLMLALASFHLDDVASNGQAAMTGQARNLIGPVGAFVADVLLYIFGAAAFLLPVTLALPGVCFVTGRPIKLRVADAIGYPVLVFFGAMAAHLWMQGQAVLGHQAGGFIGSYGAEILQALFGRTGAYIMVYAVIALTFIVTTRISLVSLAGKAAAPLARKARDASEEARKGAGNLAGNVQGKLSDRFKNWRIRRSELKAKHHAIREENARRKAEAAAARAQAREDARAARKERAPAVEAPVVEADEPVAEAKAETNPKGWRLRLPKSAKPRVDRPLDTGGFQLGDLPGARPTGAFRLGDEAPAPERRAAVAEAPAPEPKPSRSRRRAPVQEDAPTTLQPVLDADALVVEVEAPLEDERRLAENDTLFAPAVSAPPVVHRRTHAPTPLQLDFPLAGDRAAADYVMPPLRFLDFQRTEEIEVDPERLQAQADRLVEALRTFKIDGRVTEIHPGPVVTMFEFEPAPGVRISRIASLADDLAMALKAIKVRIVAPIPGKGVVGFEVPNAKREMVFLQEIIGSPAFRDKKHALPMALGKDIHGNPVFTDLAKMPHLLVAGTTGSGKSVGVNGMITSLLYHATPDEVRFIMVDPKMLELSVYEGIPHLLLPVVTDPKKAAAALNWAVQEMDRRYEVMKDAGVRNIRGYNRALDRWLAGEREDVPDFSAPLGEEPDRMPYIVVVIDEFADLMMVAGKEVEYCVARIAQKARAAGIHLILATQRPSTDVITGVIKANFPTRMAFRVSSGIDSRTILSTNGAEHLLGNGDMLYMPPGTSRLDRVHGSFVSEEEIGKIVDFIKAQREPQYLDPSVLETPEEGDDDPEGDGAEDPMYEEAVRCVFRDGRASTSHLQRRLSLGYNRAARIVDQMERDGLVGPGQGAKPRTVNKAVMGELIDRWDQVG